MNNSTSDYKIAIAISDDAYIGLETITQFARKLLLIGVKVCVVKHVLKVVIKTQIKDAKNRCSL
ncbi:hypothetical protein LCS81_24320 [Vibrio harveyi]